jgi:pyruvate carboxylase
MRGACAGYTGDVSDPRRTKYTLDYYLTFARQLVDAGIDVLAIKDMAGLLKPRAADMLVSALREEFPDLPIHVHTHDTAGTGVASMLVAAAAGADVVDVATDAMSGLTSQPSIGAIIAATQGGRFDTGLDPAQVLALNSYWEAARGLYAPFESGLKCGGADVYVHEMPGGQYTNLKFQSQSLGLGSSWTQIKEAYAAANRLLGDIVKVTPSSKVAGDLAQFMVQNGLDEAAVLAQAETLSFPGSVVEYFQGLIGQPVGGFPEPLRTRVLKDKPKVDGRPGATLPPVDLASLKAALKEKHKPYVVSDRDVLSAALYPKVFDDYVNQRKRFSDLSMLPTRAFLEGLEVDKELRIEVDKGKQLYITLKAIGELLPNGKREVFFDLNGIPRLVEVEDRRAKEQVASGGSSLQAVRERANPDVLGEVGAPMSGAVIEVKVAAGETVKAGQPLVVLSAMKMETVVAAPMAGRLRHVAVVTGDSLAAGDLLLVIEKAVKA